MKKNILYIILALGLVFSACTENKNAMHNNENVELSFFVDNYKQHAPGTNAGTNDERAINDLYLFFFPKAGQTLEKFYLNSASFTGGSWSDVDNKIALDYTQVEMGNRAVYLVANCANIKTDLDAVTSISDLENIVVNTTNPWSDNLTTPIMMVGNVDHNFNSDHQLDYIPLIRTIAKLQLNITLSNKHQAPITRVEGTTAVSQYQYQLVDFDKATYLLKPLSKPDDLKSSAWTNWEDSPEIVDYDTGGSGNVISMTLTTYLNERDNAGAKVELSLPYNPGGLLPPPEFGDDSFTLPLPDKIVRNTLYVYDIEI